MWSAHTVGVSRQLEEEDYCIIVITQNFCLLPGIHSITHNHNNYDTGISVTIILHTNFICGLWLPINCETRTPGNWSWCGFLVNEYKVNH